MNFKEISPYELSDNVFSAIGREWLLITAGDGSGRVNTMTASWGGLGIMWGKPICMCMIRPQRYTYGFVERSEYFTLSFFDEKYRDALKLCGTKSGRDCDKIAEAGLTPISSDGFVYFDEAKSVIVAKKIYADMIRPDCFIDNNIVSAEYPKLDFHKMFIGEIEKVYIEK